MVTPLTPARYNQLYNEEWDDMVKLCSEISLRRYNNEQARKHSLPRPRSPDPLLVKLSYRKRVWEWPREVNLPEVGMFVRPDTSDKSSTQESAKALITNEHMDALSRRLLEHFWQEYTGRGVLPDNDTSQLEASSLRNLLMQAKASGQWATGPLTKVVQIFTWRRANCEAGPAGLCPSIPMPDEMQRVIALGRAEQEAVARLAVLKQRAHLTKPTPRTSVSPAMKTATQDLGIQACHEEGFDAPGPVSSPSPCKRAANSDGHAHSPRPQKQIRHYWGTNSLPSSNSYAGAAQAVQQSTQASPKAVLPLAGQSNVCKAQSAPTTLNKASGNAPCHSRLQQSPMKIPGQARKTSSSYNQSPAHPTIMVDLTEDDGSRSGSVSPQNLAVVTVTSADIIQPPTHQTQPSAAINTPRSTISPAKTATPLYHKEFAQQAPPSSTVTSGYLARKTGIFLPVEPARKTFQPQGNKRTLGDGRKLSDGVVANQDGMTKNGRLQNDGIIIKSSVAKYNGDVLDNAILVNGAVWTDGHLLDSGTIVNRTVMMNNGDIFKKRAMTNKYGLSSDANLLNGASAFDDYATLSVYRTASAKTGLNGIGTLNLFGTPGLRNDQHPSSSSAHPSPMPTTTLTPQGTPCGGYFGTNGLDPLSPLVTPSTNYTMLQRATQNLTPFTNALDTFTSSPQVLANFSVGLSATTPSQTGLYRSMASVTSNGSPQVHQQQTQNFHMYSNAQSEQSIAAVNRSHMQLQAASYTNGQATPQAQMLRARFSMSLGQDPFMGVLEDGTSWDGADFY
jgi:hypothetical protein